MTPIQYFHIAFESWAVLVCVIGAICVFATREFETRSAFSLIGMLITDAVLNCADILTYYYQGRETAAAGSILRVSCFMVFFCGFILTCFASVHIEQIVVVRGGGRDQYLTKATHFIALVGCLTLILFQFTGLGYRINAQNLYSRGDYFWVLLVLEGVAFLPILCRVLKNRHVFRGPEYAAFLSFSVLPETGIIIQYFVQEISLFNVANSVSLIIIVLAHELVYTTDNVARERRRANERIRLYNSQIQPHFIYNSLTAIRASLDEPEKAEELVNHFAGFLRGSMDMLTETECIPAEREFETVENYLYVEKTRFEDMLTVEWDIKDTDYMLPAFTVQTIAENAVRHGIRGTKSGIGTVSIRSFETETAHIIEVKDDGTGFDPEVLRSIQSENPAGEAGALVDAADYRRGIQIEEMDPAHVGLSNVKKRLALMCGGTLDIRSVPGEGSLVQISIPK